MNSSVKDRLVFVIRHLPAPIGAWLRCPPNRGKISLTVTAKGQVTLRQAVLDHLGVKPGERVEDADQQHGGASEARHNTKAAASRRRERGVRVCRSQCRILRQELAVHAR
ncbi:protein of unknown function (plasmid) [Azospirillum lipoferum 4B]|uniref:AbrB/MazE/SpoVT family DNA-binding domain-containing protein n=1 Tax=Azospirillum lipoferum (strain 4B) TaxID=862719 RepID=G7ZCF3_AZOL4|nr:protein of unknown function [Azospirillum lipoferum 4B]